MNLSQLRLSTRRKLDELTETFWTDDELDGYINEGYFSLWMILLNAKHQGCLKSVFLNMIANVAEVALPSDFQAARLVERVVDQGTIPLWWDERFDEPNYTAGVSTGSYYRPTIRFVGQNMLLEPTPSDSVTSAIKLTHYFFPDRLEEDSDVPNPALHDFYHDLIPYEAVIIAKAKEESIGGGGADLGPWGVLMKDKKESFKSSVELPSVTRQAAKPFELGDY